MRGDADMRHDSADLLAQQRVALTGAVLECLGSLFGDHPLDEAGDVIQRQRPQVGHAAGQGDDLGSGGATANSARISDAVMFRARSA